MKCIATIGMPDDGHKATRIAGLLQSGLWDYVSPEDRREFTENARVMDTEGGRRILDWLNLIFGKA